MGARKLRHLAIIDRAQRRRTHGRGRDAPYTHEERATTALSFGWRVGLAQRGAQIAASETSKNLA